jgi:hypothetical protein
MEGILSQEAEGSKNYSKNSSGLDFTKDLTYIKGMNFILTFLILAVCFSLMAIGLLVAKKTLRRGCSVNPDDCACRRQGKDPSSCDQS